MTDPIVTYECRVSGDDHDIPSDDVRILRCADGGFIAACDCTTEPLSETDTPPHPCRDHLAGIKPTAVASRDWHRLDAAADGWYDGTRWQSTPHDYATAGELFAALRDRTADLANTDDSGRRDERHREVACPDCGAPAGSECRRPSGHSVRESHAARIEAAADPADDGDADSDAGTQETLLGWS